MKSKEYSRYPVLEIHRDIVRKNAVTLLKKCREIGIEPCAVVKGFCNLMPLTEELAAAGFRTAASSRVEHCKQIREAGLAVTTLLLRIPMACEVPDVVRYCDSTLVSEEKTIRMLREAQVPCKVMVGGAVLTEEYAREIGADYYARDAKRGADIAREVMSGLRGDVQSGN